MEAQGVSVRALAQMLAMNESHLGQILNGNRPLTEQLSRHISLLLEKEHDCVFVYKIELPGAKVKELCGSGTCQSVKDRQAALEAIIHHNLQELIELGKTRALDEALLRLRGVQPATPAPTPRRQPHTPAPQPAMAPPPQPTSTPQPAPEPTPAPQKPAEPFIPESIRLVDALFGNG